MIIHHKGYSSINKLIPVTFETIVSLTISTEDITSPILKKKNQTLNSNKKRNLDILDTLSNPSHEGISFSNESFSYKKYILSSLKHKII